MKRPRGFVTVIAALAAWPLFGMIPGSAGAAFASSPRKPAPDGQDTADRLARIEQAMWNRDRDILPALREWAAADHDEKVRERSLGAIALLGDSGSRQTILDRLAKDPSPRVRRAAAEAVWVLGLRVLPTRLTTPYEKDPDPYVRAECARALGRTGQREGGPSLMNRLFNDPSPEVRALTAEALALLEIPEAPPLLRYAASRDPSPFVQIFAARALADAGDPGSHALFKDLWETTEDADLRVEAFRGLLRSGAPGDWIPVGLSDGDDRVRFLAFEQWLAEVDAKGRRLTRHDSVVLRLESFLSDPLPGIRDLARQALMQKGFRVRPSGLKYVIED